MTGREPRMEGFGWLTPYITVRDPEAMLNYYEKAFGFSKGNTIPGPDGKIGHAEMVYQGQTIIMFGPEGAMGTTMKAPVTSGVEIPVNLYVYCEDVDSFCANAKQASAEIISEPQDMFWGDRMMQIKDPDGYVWNFATHNRVAIEHD